MQGKTPNANGAPSEQSVESLIAKMVSFVDMVPGLGTSVRGAVTATLGPVIAIYLAVTGVVKVLATSFSTWAHSRGTGMGRAWWKTAALATSAGGKGASFLQVDSAKAAKGTSFLEVDLVPRDRADYHPTENSWINTFFVHVTVIHPCTITMYGRTRTGMRCITHKHVPRWRKSGEFIWKSW